MTRDERSIAEALALANRHSLWKMFTLDQMANYFALAEYFDIDPAELMSTVHNRRMNINDMLLAIT